MSSNIEALRKGQSFSQCPGVSCITVPIQMSKYPSKRSICSLLGGLCELSNNFTDWHFLADRREELFAMFPCTVEFGFAND